MKLFRLPALSLASMLLGFTGGFPAAAQDFVVDSFNDSTTLACWYLRWGPAQSDWDPFQDHTGGNSGALSLAMSYTNDPAAQNNFGFGRLFCCTCSTWDATTIDATRYKEVAAWIRWDTNSSIGIDAYNADGEAGLVAGFWTVSNSLVQLPVSPIPTAASNGWTRIRWPIDFTMPGIDQAAGFLLKKWDTQTLSGNVRFWVDDITLVSYPCCALPTPTMAIQTAQPGLNLFTGTSSEYERENIRTARDVGSFSWLGSGDNPVSYSFTVTNVDFATNNFQIHLFLVTNPGDESFPDWTELSVVRADLLNVGPENHGQWSLSYKTNTYGFGNVLSAYTSVASVSNASLLGTWTLTFLNDTNVTMTSPGGGSTNFTIPPDVAACFPEPLLVYFGVEANELPNQGRPAVLSSVAIDGATVTTVHDHFSGPLDTNLWEVIAGYPPGIQVVEPGSLWVQWTTPDFYFFLQTNSVLSDTGAWSTNGLPSPISLLNRRQVLIPPSLGPKSGQSLFFRMGLSIP